MTPQYEADAVEAERICDEKTPRAKGKNWRVAFYRNLRLFAVINVPMTRIQAEKTAKLNNELMAQAVEKYILGIARQA